MPTLLPAGSAKVEWSDEKKQWHVVITVGAEVIKRWVAKLPHDAGDDALRSAAITTAQDEGYQLDAGQVAIAR
jgi:hypothetical protein